MLPAEIPGKFKKAKNIILQRCSARKQLFVIKQGEGSQSLLARLRAVSEKLRRRIKMDEKKYDECIVLLAEEMQKDPLCRSGWKLSLASHMRLAAAAELYLDSLKSGKKPCLVIAGGKLNGPGNPPISEILKETITRKNNAERKYNIKEEDIYTEGESQDTSENAEFSKRIISFMGLEDRIKVITSADHIARARTCFRLYGLNPEMIYAENVLSGMSQRHNKLVDSYLKSTPAIWNHLKNDIFDIFLKILGPKPARICAHIKYRI